MHYWTTFIVLLFVASRYWVKLATFRRAWKKIPLAPPTLLNPQISVVVPFRNEAQNLPTILQELALQKDVQAEFIFVDDHSSDSGALLVSEWAMRDNRFKLVANDPQEVGKKAAIKKGIDTASFRWVATTDADTTRSEQWLQHIANHIFPNVHLICAPVVIDSSNYFSKFQSLEMCVLNTITGASIQMGAPLMCSGANLAFDKDALLDLNDHHADAQLLSGDDVFLMQRMMNAGKGISYCASPNAAVHTQAARWNDFWRQRVRWAGKTSAVKNQNANKFAQLLFVTNFVAIWSIVGAFAIEDLRLLFVAFLCAKTASELLVLMPSAVRFGKTKDLISLPWLVLTYPFYTMGIGLLSLWWRPKWKGRDLSLASK